jgi:hypothetical protein
MVQQAMLPYNLSYADYSAVYNALSFVMASVHHSSSCRRARCQLAAASPAGLTEGALCSVAQMGASTIYFFFHAHLVQARPRAPGCCHPSHTL